MTDRAVSETLGFVLAFALITSTVGVVYVSGIGGLTDARNAEQVNNAERAFDVLADNMADIHQRNAPSRATEIKLANAQLGYDETTELSVEVSGGGSADTVKVAPIVYTDESGTEIVYEAGAIVRTDPNGGSVMKREPNMLFRVDDGSTVAILPLLQTRTTESGGVGGSTTVLVRGTHAVSEVLTARTGGDTVTFTVDTTAERAPVWKRYLEAEMDESTWNSDCKLAGTDDDIVECSFEVDRLYVAVTGIDVSIS